MTGTRFTRRGFSQDFDENQSSESFFDSVDILNIESLSVITRYKKKCLAGVDRFIYLVNNNNYLCYLSIIYDGHVSSGTNVVINTGNAIRER